MGVGSRRHAAARRHRAHHRRQHQRRHRNHHHHHHRTRHNVASVGLGLFGAQRYNAQTIGNQATMVTMTTTTSSSSAAASTSSNTRRLPAWFGSAVVTILLLGVSIAGFAVPAVPIPVGITSMLIFFLIIVLPLARNLQVRAARRREGVVNDPEAPSPYTVTGGLGGGTVVITELSTVGETSVNGPTGVPVFNYDPPPSFSEAMEDTASPSAPWLEGAPAQTPPGYPSTIGGTLQDPVYPPMGAPVDEEELPPPPSYDDVISGNTYTSQ